MANRFSLGSNSTAVYYDSDLKCRSVLKRGQWAFDDILQYRNGIFFKRLAVDSNFGL